MVGPVVERKVAGWQPICPMQYLQTIANSNSIQVLNRIDRQEKGWLTRKKCAVFHRILIGFVIMADKHWMDSSGAR